MAVCIKGYGEKKKKILCRLAWDSNQVPSHYTITVLDDSTNCYYARHGI